MYAPTVEQENQGFPPPPQNPYAQPSAPPQPIVTGYPYAHHHLQYPPPPPPPPQNPDAQPEVQYVQAAPPQNSAQFVNMVYVQPPPQFYLQQGGYDIPALWASDLFACTEDPSNCCLTCWCPCITFGQIAEIVDEGSPSCAVSGGIHLLLSLAGYAVAGFSGLVCLTGFAWCYSCMYRSKMRAKFNLAENPCSDCLVHCFCDPCALCQEYKELKHRGYDPALGWRGNLQRQQPEMVTARAPPVNPTMAR